MGASTQEKAAAALRFCYLPSQPKGGSRKVFELRLLTSFESRFLLSAKVPALLQTRRYRFVWDFMLFKELFSLITINKC